MDFNDNNVLKVAGVLFVITAIVFFILWATGVFGRAVGNGTNTEVWKDPCPIGSTICLDGTSCCGGQCCMGGVYRPFN